MVLAAFERPVGPARYLADHAGEVAGAAFAMAMRFHHGGKLLTFGTGAASTDAQHVAVEFVHPVMVGKRAPPALSLSCDVATVTGIAARAGMARIFSHQLGQLAEPGDIGLGICADGSDPSVLAGLVSARDAGLLTVALAGDGGGAIASSAAAAHLLIVPSRHPPVIEESQVTT